MNGNGISNRELAVKLRRTMLDNMEGITHVEMTVNLDDIRAAVAFLSAMPNGRIYSTETPPVVEYAPRAEIIHMDPTSRQTNNG